MTLEKVEISPLMIRTMIKIKNESDITWQNRQNIFEVIYGNEIQSITKYGTVHLGMTLGSGTYEGFERSFGSNLLDQPESLNLILKTGTGKNAKEINVPILP